LESEQQLTPMLKQYFELKKEADGAILFFRMGDFYEIFGDDAELIAPKLDIVLTAREKGDQTKIPFCGVPHHAAVGYWLKLIRLGYKVAIVEQLEAATAAKGLVKRGIVRTYTPGSLDELEGLDRDAPNYLLSYIEHSGKSIITLALCDVSTGEFRLGAIEGSDLAAIISQFRPKEILTRRFALEPLKSLIAEKFESENIYLGALAEAPLKDSELQAAILAEHLGASKMADQPCGPVDGGDQLVCSVLTYIKSLNSPTLQFSRILPLRDPGTMFLSDTVVRDLELFETARRRNSEGSLAKTIDRTLSPMGSRALRYALSHPFSIAGPIIERHEAVDRLLKAGPSTLELVRQELKNMPDLARLSTRIVSCSSSPLELAAIREALKKATSLSQILSPIDFKHSCLDGVGQILVEAKDVLQRLECALVDSPVHLGSGKGVIRQGYNAKLDAKTSLAASGEQQVDLYEAKIRQETGISNLKIKSHKTFGLLIEVTKSNFSKIPKSFIRRQTMVNCERFITPELKDLSDDLASASDDAVALEADVYRDLMQNLAPLQGKLLLVSKALSEVDLLQSFAWIALKENWCKPVLQTSGTRKLIVRAGRHPVVEKLVGKHQFCANDVVMIANKSHLLITGPNMAGKSTVMRQTAILAILNQAGSYIPAKSGELPIFDRIFTRVGASDDLSRGQSTFMVEMTEAAEILRQSTHRSLVILDEVGRGTSSSDGLALASAIFQDLVDRVKCFTMFATHYHELVPMMEAKIGVNPVQTEISQSKSGGITFTHRLIEGASKNSFGIEVARLAGIPSHVLQTASSFLDGEKVSVDPEKASPSKTSTTHAPAPHIHGASKVQRDLFGLEPINFEESIDRHKSQALPSHLEQIISRLEAVKIHRTTPLQALNIIDEMKRMLIPTSQKNLFDNDSINPQ
jgi:DNA mismatch repair protein MutS